MDLIIAIVVPILTAIISALGLIKANRAEKNSRPISNGFAGGVKTSLKHIEAHLEDVHKDIREVRGAVIDHLKDHN
jgi:hypothetical protein